MAKKTIKAQMKQRRDTKANWAATNPVLLDGELGIVSDDPNLYKVGDGATAWNSLPFRGFDGTLAQELGTSPNAAISQKVVSEKLTELESYFSAGTEIEGKYVNYQQGLFYDLRISLVLEREVAYGMVVIYKPFINTPDYRGLAFYDKDDRFIVGYQALTEEQIIEVPENAVMLRASVLSKGDAIISSYNSAIALNNLKITELLQNFAKTILRQGIIKNTSEPFDNLNTYPINSMYSVTNSAFGEVILNRPSENITNFQIYTFSPYDSTMVFQICCSSNGDIYIRSCWGIWWYGWKELKSYTEIKAYIDAEVIKIDKKLSEQKIETDTKIAELKSRISYGEITEGFYIHYINGESYELRTSHYLTMQVSGGMRILYQPVASTIDNRGLAFYDKSGIFIKGYQALLETQNIIVPDNAVICKASVNSPDKVFLYAYNNAINNIVDSLNNEIDEVKTTVFNQIGNNLLTAFDNLVCVGDSLTFSQVYTANDKSRQAKVTYPQALARMCGNQQMTLARAGATALACWNEFNTQIVAKDNALAIIYLGTNYGVTDTLSEDVIGDNPDNWANNNIGAYCRFIKKFKDLGYKVLLLNIWATSGTGESNLANSQSAIRHIAERFQCAVMDVPVTSSMEYHYYPDLSGFNGVHYNDLGYSWFASQLINKIGQLPIEQIKWIIPNA